MNLTDYFEHTEGRGVLSTADAQGKVDAAVYARPHVQDDNTLAFIMADKLSHANLQENPYAVYLFMENSDHYVGKRLYLKKVRETDDTELVENLRRRDIQCYHKAKNTDEKKFVVYFEIEHIRPLVGDAQ